MMPDTESFFSGRAAAEREARAVKRQRGHTRKQSGATLETHVQRAHEAYLSQRVGCFSKLQPHVAGPPTALRYTRASDADFMGWVRVADTTHPVMFDAKSDQRGVMRWPEKLEDRKRLLMQIHNLQMFASAPGALGFLLCVDETLGWGWFVAGPALQRLKDGYPVPLRTITRGVSRTLTHHVPAFPLNDTVAIATGHPYVDWRAGVPDLLAWLATARA